MKIKTVKINRNGEPVIINASDFRYGSDVLWSDEPALEASTESAETPPIEKPDVKLTHKGAGRWVVEVNGHQAHDGTLSKAAAQALAEQY
jgi:hypothetical protein